MFPLPFPLTSVRTAVPAVLRSRNGKSATFPVGVRLTRLSLVYGVDVFF